MQAEHIGAKVILTMTAQEAAALENELLWSAHDDDTAMLAAHEALSELNLPEAAETGP